MSYHEELCSWEWEMGDRGGHGHTRWSRSHKQGHSPARPDRRRVRLRVEVELASITSLTKK
eukprot:scaffold2434_cov70-Cyclotella_meneghiniana.AAC.2